MDFRGGGHSWGWHLVKGHPTKFCYRETSQMSDPVGFNPSGAVNNFKLKVANH